MIQYQKASDVQDLAFSIVDSLELAHIKKEKLHFYRSFGSRSRYTRARIHGLSRIWNDALAMDPLYIIEVIAERYDDLPPHEKEKVIIHELLHVPRGFSGGFVSHGPALSKHRIESLHQAYHESFKDQVPA